MASSASARLSEGHDRDAGQTPLNPGPARVTVALGACFRPQTGDWPSGPVCALRTERPISSLATTRLAQAGPGTVTYIERPSALPPSLASAAISAGFFRLMPW